MRLTFALSFRHLCTWAFYTTTSWGKTYMASHLFTIYISGPMSWIFVTSTAAPVVSLASKCGCVHNSSRNLLFFIYFCSICSKYYSERSRDGGRLGRMVRVPNSLNRQSRPLLVWLCSHGCVLPDHPSLSPCVTHPHWMLGSHRQYTKSTLTTDMHLTHGYPPVDLPMIGSRTCCFRGICPIGLQYRFTRLAVSVHTAYSIGLQGL
jgi:hypothetical protein